MQTKNLVLTLGLLVLSACAQSVQSEDPGAAPVESTDSRRNADPERAVRLCETTLVGATKGKLISFFGGQFPISNLEGPATGCFDILPSGTGKANLSLFRVEYEDDYGVTYAEFDNSHVLQGDYKFDDATDKWTIDFVLADAYGVIGIKGISAANSDNVNLTIKYANLGSFEEQLKKQAEKLAEECRNGTKTVAQCMGYNFPQTQWWNDPNYLAQFEESYMLTEAKSLLTSGSTLGTMLINLGERDSE